MGRIYIFLYWRFYLDNFIEHGHLPTPCIGKKRIVPFFVSIREFSLTLSSIVSFMSR